MNTRFHGISGIGILTRYFNVVHNSNQHVSQEYKVQISKGIFGCRLVNHFILLVPFYLGGICINNYFHIKFLLQSCLWNQVISHADGIRESDNQLCNPTTVQTLKSLYVFLLCVYVLLFIRCGRLPSAVGWSSPDMANMRDVGNSGHAANVKR